MNATTHLEDEPEIRMRRLVPTPLTTTTSAATHTQERLSWLFDQYLESASDHLLPARDISSKVLAQRVFELLSNRDLLDGPLSKVARPVRTLYPEMPGDVLTAWWEKRGLTPEPKLSEPLASSPPSAEKENIPPITSPAHWIPITTPHSTTSSPAATLLSTPEPTTSCPPGETVHALSSPMDASAGSLPEEHSSPRIPSLEPSAHIVAQPARETSRPALSSISNISPYTPRALLPLLDDFASSASKSALQPSTSLLIISPQSQKRHKRSSSTNPNHSIEIVPDSDAVHDTPTYNDLDETNHDLQSVPTVTSKMWKDIGDPVAAKRRFLYERMNIFDIRQEWEPTPPQTRMIQREEGEGRMEYLARINLL